MNDIVIDEIAKMLKESNLLPQNDLAWQSKIKHGQQRLDIRFKNEEYSFRAPKVIIPSEINVAETPGLREFHYFSVNVKSLVLSIIGFHFRVF